MFYINTTQYKNTIELSEMWKKEHSEAKDAIIEAIKRFQLKTVAETNEILNTLCKIRSKRKIDNIQKRKKNNSKKIILTIHN